MDVIVTDVLAVKRQLSDLEKAHSALESEHKGVQKRLKSAEHRVAQLEAKLEDEGRESSDLELLRQRLTEELDDEREQHQKDLAERDFNADQTRKKYQGTLVPCHHARQQI